MNHQSFLLERLEESLKLLPKVIYLNDIINTITFTAKVHLGIILSYFFQCHNCKNFFNEEDVRKCKCREWCKFCARMNIIRQKCNRCVDKKVYDKEIILNCIFSDCKEEANFGSTTQALYCAKHASTSITISHYFFCDEKLCYKTGIYYDKCDAFPKCEKHASDKQNIFIREGKNYIASHDTKTCDVCKKSCTVIYACGHCDINRCGKCRCFDMFYLSTKSSSDGVYCSSCVHKYKLHMYQGYFMDRQTECIKCYDKGCYANSEGNVYCKKHCDINCVFTNGACSITHCFALAVMGGVMTSKFCRFHGKEYEDNIAKYANSFE